MRCPRDLGVGVLLTGTAEMDVVVGENAPIALSKDRTPAERIPISQQAHYLFAAQCTQRSRPPLIIPTLNSTCLSLLASLSVDLSVEKRRPRPMLCSTRLGWYC